MDSPQSVVSLFKTGVVAEPEKQISDYLVPTIADLSKQMKFQRKEAMLGNPENSIGSLQIYIHQARDIHNICIYHKQDVYAKLCLTSDPENTVSTKIINGGGRNPVFNESLRLNINTVDSSLKCEIFMMSRVKNYLEDQLLGFSLVPLSEVLLKNGKLEKEFSLSSTDLFHSPAGFIQLSLSYNGASPDVMAIPRVCTVQDELIQESVPCEFEKIEFPDPKLENEDQMMVSEYFGMSCTNDESEISESVSDGAHVAGSFKIATAESVEAPKPDSPPSSVSTNGVSSPSVAASSDTSDASKTLDQASDGPMASKTPYEEHDSTLKEKKGSDVGDGESDSCGGVESEKIAKPIITVNIEPEQNVVQQDIVDMYMKSMQQFTESLAKMKLPLDIDSGPTSSGSSTSDQKMQASRNSSSRVFYGSRAFF